MRNSLVRSYAAPALSKLGISHRPSGQGPVCANRRRLLRSNECCRARS